MDDSDFDGDAATFTIIIDVGVALLTNGGSGVKAYLTPMRQFFYLKIEIALCACTQTLHLLTTRTTT